jgi:hypothetical protein
MGFIVCVDNGDITNNHSRINYVACRLSMEYRD